MNYYLVTDRQTDGRTESDAYEPTVQYAQVGSIRGWVGGGGMVPVAGPSWLIGIDQVTLGVGEAASQPSAHLIWKDSDLIQPGEPVNLYCSGWT